jgi:hypothetical protein
MVISNLKIQLVPGDYRGMCCTLLREFNSSEEEVWYNAEIIKNSNAFSIRH